MNAHLLRWFGVVTLIAATWYAFAPALHGEFLWDDHSEIVSNAEIKAADGLRRIWTGQGTLDYFPLKSTVQWLQWRLWGERPFGYHVTNLVLHIAGALLVWQLLAKLGVRLGWIGGFLFAVHPVTVESVAWIAELKNVLSLPPLLLSAICYIDFVERREPWRLVASIGLFLVAALSKTSVVMFPVVLLVYLWWRTGRVERAALFTTIPYFLISLTLGLVTIWFQHQRAVGTWVIDMGTLWERSGRAVASVAFYVGKSVWPGTLLPVYPRATIESAALQIVGLAAIAGLAVACWRRRDQWGRHVVLGGSWFLLHLLPVVGFVKMAFFYFGWVSDHFVYLPLVGVIGLAAAGCEHVWRARPALRWVVAAAVGVTGLLGLVQTRRHAAHYTSEQALWSYTLAHNPEAWLGHSNLAAALLLQKRFTEALEHANAAIRLKADYAPAHANAVNALANLGRADDALAATHAAERSNAASAELYANAAVALLRAGSLPPAIALYERALRIKPVLAKAHKELGVALYLAGRMQDAVASYERGLALAPDAETHANCGVALLTLGRLDEAIRHYEAALQLSPNHVDAHYNYGIALVRANQPAAALTHFDEVLRQNPAHAEAFYNRGEALLLLGRRDDAKHAFATALRLRPTLSKARQQLSKLEEDGSQP